MTRLDKLLRGKLTLSNEDQEILKGRKDDRFSQVVRNLVSHRTLERHGLAEYHNTGTYRRGAYYLTQKGADKVGGIYKPPPRDLFERRRNADE